MKKSQLADWSISLIKKSSAAAVFAISVIAIGSGAHADTLIEQFETGDVNIAACGHDVFDFHQSPEILGGAREARARDGHSCVFGGRSRVTIDTVTQTAAFYGRSACEQSIQYGTEIGTIDHPWSLSPNKGKGTELNLALTLDTEVQIDVVNLPSSGPTHVSVRLRSNGATFSHAIFLDQTGVISAPLSNFTGLTAADAADIDGISFRTGVCPSNNIVDALILNAYAFSGGDSDGDGVPNADDLCPDTAEGATVNEDGCSGEQLVELLCPSTASYRNHGEYVSCVARASEEAVAQGLLTEEEKDAIVSSAARSSIGISPNAGNGGNGGNGGN